MNLLELTLQQLQARHDAAVAAVQSRADDIATLDRLMFALRSRGWAAQASVDTAPIGCGASVTLWLHLSATERELADALEFLGRDGVSAHRVVNHERRTMRHYSLRLANATVQLYAYVHPAQVAA